MQLAWVESVAFDTLCLPGASTLVNNLQMHRFWKTNVGSQAAVKSGMFGAATKAINGKIECSGGDSSVPMKRYAIYVSTLKALQVNETPQEGGCYN